MPKLAVNGVELHYIEGGEGATTVVLSHGLLMDYTMFAPQWDLLAEEHRVVAYEHRGQGRSSGADAPCDLDTLCDDAADFIAALGRGPVHFVGMSMGGMVGLRLAARFPHLVRSLVLIDSSAQPEPLLQRLRFGAMCALVPLLGVQRFIPRVLRLMFGPSTHADPGKQALLAKWREKLSALPPGIVRQVRGVMNRRGISGELGGIRCPTLVVFGAEDELTPADCSWHIATRILNAEVLRVENAGHSSNLEQPGVVNQALLDFLARVEGASR
jgi:pimeloyl-ACP methyl ester carboxylesterase